MSGRASCKPPGVTLNIGGRGLTKRAAQTKEALAARYRNKSIVKEASPFDLLEGRGAAGRGPALPQAVIAGLGLLPSAWLVRSSSDRARSRFGGIAAIGMRSYLCARARELQTRCMHRHQQRRGPRRRLGAPASLDV